MNFNKDIEIKKIQKIKDAVEKKKISFKKFDTLQNFYSFVFKQRFPLIGANGNFFTLAQFNEFIIQNLSTVEIKDTLLI